MRHGLNERAESLAALSLVFDAGRFGRMFPHLRPLVVPDAALVALAQAMQDTRPASAGNNPGIPAGFTYLGQFVDHDITLDTTSLPERQVDPLATHNFRTPALDLDSLYGGGPDARPYLYERANPARFVLGKNAPSRNEASPSNIQVPPGSGVQDPPNDLPRNRDGRAIIGDPRNDENLIVAQLHLALLKFHNKVVDTQGVAFEEARRIVTWHYQWIVLHDFLRRLIDPATLDDVLDNGRRFYHFLRDAFIPVEFSGAAYRLGHSMVREEYDYNRVFNPSPNSIAQATFQLLFHFTGMTDPAAPSGLPVPTPVPSNWIIDWQRFFELPLPAPTKPNSPTLNPSRLLDPFVVPALHTLPPGVVGAGATTNQRMLPFRNLKRGVALGLPSGQAVAAAMGLPALSAADLGSGPDGVVAQAQGLVEATPLWFYVLKEAEVQTGGQRLGAVGSRLLAEVFVGLLEGDGTSFLAQAPEWTPTLTTSGDFTMVDLLTFVGEINPLGNP